MRQRLEVVTAVLVVIVLLAALVWAVPQFLAPLSAPLSAPTPTASPSATRSVTPSASAPPAGPRAVVLSLSGLRPDLVEKYAQQGDMPHLTQIAASGAKAEYAQAIYPALPAASYAAIASGARADVTGIVANTFHVSGTVVYETQDGLSAPLPVDPLWETASKQGLKTATVCWPGSEPRAAAHRADYIVGYGVRDVDANLHHLRFTRVVTESADWTGLPRSFSPWLESTLPIIEGGEVKYYVHALLVDTTDDKGTNYDTLLLDMDQAIDEDTPRGRPGEWIALETDPLVHAGAYFKAASFDPHDFSVYQSAICYNAAAPTDLLRGLNAQVGFYPADPDYQALERGWITPADYLAMLERQCQWIADAVQFVDRTYRPELILAGLSSPAMAQQRFLLVDARQPGYSPARVQEYEEYVRQAYRIADAQLGRIAAVTDRTTTALFVISEHGTVPVHTVVNVNKVLVDQGLLTLVDGQVDAEQTETYAIAAGGTVHLYVNLMNREAGGIVPEQSYDLVRETAIAALQDIRDATGAPVFPLILRREEADGVHLNHPHSGDVIAFAGPGYLASSALGRDQVFESAADLGQSGYEPIWPEMQAVFVAGGYGIRPGVFAAPVSTLDIAPTIARLLKLRPADHWQGQVLTDILAR